MELSIVVPAYNEEDSVAVVYSHLSGILRKSGKTYEIIFVNDGSTDNTLANLKKIRESDKNIKIISFTKNFKKASALAAGLKAASGKIIITIDADMQDDPSEIPQLLKKIEDGYDMAVGWKYPRNDPISKIVSSRIFNSLVRMATGLKIHDCDSNFRAMKKEVVPHLELYSGLYRYIPVIAHQKGFKITEVKVKHNPRVHGKSKYSVTRLYTGFFDLITIKFLLEYNKRPLHFFGSIGFFSLSLGFIAGAYLLYLKYILGNTIGQRPLLILTMLLIFLGMQIISIGLVGEMVANSSQKKKDEYVIKEKYGFE